MILCYRKSFILYKLCLRLLRFRILLYSRNDYLVAKTIPTYEKLPMLEENKLKITGLQNGAVLQREVTTDACAILIHGEITGSLRCDVGLLTQVDENTWCLSGIIVGGPYTITLSDNFDSVTFFDI